MLYYTLTVFFSKDLSVKAYELIMKHMKKLLAYSMFDAFYIGLYT